MEDEKLKKQIGANIAAYRKYAGLTQLGLAEKLNYSVKAISRQSHDLKWMALYKKLFGV